MTAVGACERCGSALEAGDLRCPICALAVAPGRVAEVERERARVVRCGTCGASLAYSAEAQAPRCAYCASVMRVEVAADPQEQARWFVPFTVEPEAARRALEGFLGQGGFFRPKDLASASAVHSVRAMWWPAWVFDARARVSWAADSDAGAGRSAWAPHAGQVELGFRDILVSASRGLTREECARLGERYALAGALEEARGPEGAAVERFDVTRSGARRQIGEAVEAAARREVERTQIPGRRFRNVHVAVVLSGLETRRYALPAYVLAYRYRDKLYRVVVHGQDAGCVLGSKPVAVGRVVLVGGVALLVLLVLALLLGGR
jgi:hypothetical protein